MVVSPFIFAVVSSLFTVAIVQYLHTTNTDAIRSRSSTEIATSVRTLDRYVRNAKAVKGDTDKVTLVTYDDEGVEQCAVIEYTNATWTGGTMVSDYGSVAVKTRPYAAAPYTNLKKQPVWVRLDNSGTSATSSPTGQVKFIGDTNGHWETNTSDLISGNSTMNPLNRTCMLATTTPIVDAAGGVLPKKSIAQNLDLSNKPQAGSGVIIMPEAYYANNGTYQYTEECRTDGQYSSLNTWLYYPDNSIRLSSDTSLCVTGGSIDKYNSPATLQLCGTSYGPRVKDGAIQWNDSSYVNPYYPELAKNDEEKQQAIVNQDKEKRDPNSLLNKYQKWIFYNGFINAGYLNDTNYEDIREAAANYDIGLPESKGYSVSGLQPKEQTKFMRLEPTHWAAVRLTKAMRTSQAVICLPRNTTKPMWLLDGPTTSTPPRTISAATCRTPPHRSARLAKPDTAPSRL